MRTLQSPISSPGILDLACPPRLSRISVRMSQKLLGFALTTASIVIFVWYTVWVIILVSSNHRTLVSKPSFLIRCLPSKTRQSAT